MTKKQRKEIYWAAMFEEVAFEKGFWSSLDAAYGGLAAAKKFPETRLGEGPIAALDRLEICINKCEE